MPQHLIREPNSKAYSLFRKKKVISKLKTTKLKNKMVNKKAQVNMEYTKTTMLNLSLINHKISERIL